tara:strand:- start:56 stop:388 length:333 start_codon:yes stop_codon:yes gene_type:complete
LAIERRNVPIVRELIHSGTQFRWNLAESLQAGRVSQGVPENKGLAGKRRAQFPPENWRANQLFIETINGGVWLLRCLFASKKELDRIYFDVRKAFGDSTLLSAAFRVMEL